MCGLAGMWDTSGKFTRDEREAVVTQMAQTLLHRGPDDFGVWQDAAQGVVLGFRRLAIRDLSPAGHQPMLSPSGRYALIFNGEVYNSEAMRDELAASGHSTKWRGTSDTEAMLAAIEAWGLFGAVQKFVGMFALVLWDRETRTVSLVRDRLGIKPLYYGWAGKTLLFGSELKALRACPDFAPTLDLDAVALFLRYAYVPAPHSIYSSVKKLPPATILTLNASGDETITEYWSLADIAASGQQHPFIGSDADAVEAFIRQAREAVRLRMIADVPLGAFLSGGLDSSLVVALMQEISGRPVETFCIGFTEEAYNEAHYARAVAKHLGTEHHEHLATPEEAIAVMPKLPTLYDEPFADASQIPTFLVSELARTKVTVSLSGDGGDELLAGYHSYTHGEQIRALHRKLPGPLLPFAAGAIRTVPVGAWQSVLSGKFAGDKLHKLADALPLGSAARVADNSLLHDHLMAHWRESAPLAPPHKNYTLGRHAHKIKHRLSAMEQAMYADTLTYLPDDVLTKVDRASMAASLEARVPLLDHRFVAFCWSLPMTYKRRDGQTKWILRQALDRYLPRTLFDRPKRGFGVPIDDWLRGPLREWAEDLLSEASLAEGGLLDPAPIRARWQAHLSGTRNYPGPLWNVLMLQAWRRHGK